jgi:hypothetical protein
MPPTLVVINDVSFEEGTFKKIDGESYKVFSIWSELFRFGGHTDVVLRIILKDKNKETKTLFFTKETYWLQGNQQNPKAIPELKCEIIVSMTDEEFYVKPVEAPYVPFNWDGCVPSRDK